jgi:hypothetical protein
VLYSFRLSYLIRVGPTLDDDSYLKEPKTLNEAAKHFVVRLRRVEELLCAPFLPLCCDSENRRHAAAKLGGWDIIFKWCAYRFIYLYFIWYVNLFFWLLLLLISPWAKSFYVGIMWSLMKSLMSFMWCDDCFYSLLFLCFVLYIFIYEIDKLSYKCKFIVMRHLIVNGFKGLIWLSREWTHDSYLKT